MEFKSPGREIFRENETPPLAVGHMYLRSVSLASTAGADHEKQSLQTLSHHLLLMGIFHTKRQDSGSLQQRVFFLFQNILFYEKEIPVIYMLKMNLELFKNVVINATPFTV